MIYFFTYYILAGAWMMLFYKKWHKKLYEYMPFVTENAVKFYLFVGGFVFVPILIIGYVIKLIKYIK